MVVIAALPVLAQDGSISAERIREHTRFLSLDLLEGRGVGQRGGDIATEYIATEFALAGAQPAGGNGSYFQKVPLVGIETTPDARLSAAAGRRAPLNAVPHSGLALPKASACAVPRTRAVVPGALARPRLADRPRVHHLTHGE